MRAREDSGYAMLAALVVMVLASVFVLTAVAAVGAVHGVGSSDAAGWRADEAAAEALAAACAAVRWSPAPAGEATAVGGDLTGLSWAAAWTAPSTSAGAVWPVVTIRAEGRQGPARSTLLAAADLRVEAWSVGLSCASDVVATAPLVVAGSGVYAGGRVVGRENVSFAPAEGSLPSPGVPADVVRDDLCPETAVHAGGEIYGRGTEIHEDGAPAEWAFDTDVHTSPGTAPAPEAPSRGFLASALQNAVDPGDAFLDGHLRLEGMASALTPVADRCVVARAAGAVRITGAGPGAGTRLLIVVPGDAEIGEPGSETSFSGALVVLGRLTVLGVTRVSGGVYAGAILVQSPLVVRVVSDWRARPLAGACRPTLVEIGP